MLNSPFIAVVDDNDDVRLSMESFLRSAGYAVRGFPSAQSFLDSFADATPSCLISDIQMPGINGLELLRQVMAVGKELPVILITAYPEPVLQQHAQSAGAHCFLSKPFDAEALIACLDGCLSGVPSG